MESSDRYSVSTIRVNESDICYSETPMGKLAPEVNDNDQTIPMNLGIKAKNRLADAPINTTVMRISTK